MHLVKDNMRTPVITISPEAGLDRALVIMRNKRIRHLPVVENGDMVGLLADRDLRLSMVEMEGPQSAPKGMYLPALTKVRKLMIETVRTVTPDTAVQEAANIMSENKIGCLPVLEQGTRHVVGIITESDMLRLLVKILNQEKT